MNIVLMLVDDPDPDDPAGQTWIQSANYPDHTPRPVFASQGEVNLLCGACGFTVAEKLMSAGQIGGMNIQCARCGKYNATRT